MKILNIVSCAVLRDSKVLLIYRKKPPYATWWALPGGKLEVGETLVEGTKRELMEETGLTLGEMTYHSTLNETYRVDGELHAHFVVHYFVSRLDGEQEALEQHEGEVRWFDLDDLPKDLVPSDRHILQRLDEIGGVFEGEMHSQIVDGRELLRLESMEKLRLHVPRSRVEDELPEE